MTEPHEIATLPPIEELDHDVPRSPRTGEPPRTAVVVASSILFHLAATVLTLAYALHWWAAVHPETYPASARLVEWVAPEPGKWLSLTLEGALAAALVLAAGSCGVVGFHAWNGWRWTRWGGGLGVLLAAAFAVVLGDLAFIGAALAGLGTVGLFLPPEERYFQQWRQVRATSTAPYRRPVRIVYGRLPRFR